MLCYFDTAYVAKSYLNEPGGGEVRVLCGEASERISSELLIAELSIVFHRHVREGKITNAEANEYREQFEADVTEGYWLLLPIDAGLLTEVSRRLAVFSPEVFVRAGDAIHLCTAALYGVTEVWTNDRHMLAAARHFGILGRSV